MRSFKIIIVISDKNKSSIPQSTKQGKSTENFRETFKYLSDDESKITRNFSLIKSSDLKETSSTFRLKSNKKDDLKTINCFRTNYGFNSS